MKKLLLIAVCAASMTFSAIAQDARLRTSETVVADALAQLPIKNQKTYNSVMGELLATGSNGVQQIADMLVPADKGKNNITEYALEGLVAYTGKYATDDQRANVAAGLATAIDKCSDNANKAYLMTLLQRISRKSDTDTFLKYIGDKYLSESAQNGLIITPDCDDVVLNLVNSGTISKAVAARLVGAKAITDAEPTLLSWLNSADTETKTAIYKALGDMGTTKSVATLAAVAQTENYQWLDTDATAAYLKLINRLAASSNAADKKVATAQAKTVLKKATKSSVRSAALNAIMTADGKASKSYLLDAMKEASRDYRVAALRNCEPWADAEIYAALAKVATGKGVKPVKADVVNWFGTNRVEEQVDAVIANISSTDDEIATAAIAAAAKIGGEKALNALIDQIDGSRSDDAVKALLAFNGNINNAVIAVLNDDNASEAQQVAALQLASARRMKSAATTTFRLLNSSSPQVAAAANSALVGVVSPDDYDTLCKMLEKADDSRVPDIQKALKASVLTLSSDEKFNKVKPYVEKSSNPALYYPLLAQANNSQAIAALSAAYAVPQTRSAAFAAMLDVDNQEIVELLYNIATTDAANNEAALNRYAALVAKSGNNSIRLYQLFRRGLEASASNAASKNMLKGLAATGTYQAIIIADKAIDNTAVADAAATTVRSVVSKNITNYGGAPVRNALNRAKAIFADRKAKGSADAGYAVDDINGMIPKIVDLEYAQLTGNNLAFSAVTTAKTAKAQKAADATAAKAWSITTDGIKFQGGDTSTIAIGDNLENYEMWIEWRGNGTAGVGVRSMPQVDLQATNPAGEWNTAYIKVVNDRITVDINGVNVSNNTTITNTYSPGSQISTTGKILLSAADSEVEFRDILVRALPSTPRSELTAEEKAEGFEMLFDGTSMHKWEGNTAGYIPRDGYIYVDSKFGGNLYTIKEYSDFIFRFEFSLDRPGVNNGVGLRTPEGKDAAYHGMEIQILDHDDPMYKNLRAYQVHGSVYGIIPAKRVKFQHGVWNTEEIRAIGDHIVVIVNGDTIVDGNIREACQGHNVSEDGSATNPWTVDKKNHPGLFNTTGHLGFLGHGTGIRFRNVRVKDLSTPTKKSKK